MPPACPVEIHGRCYNARVATSFLKCHRLARWRFALVATGRGGTAYEMPPACPVEIRACCYGPRRDSFEDATGLPGGDSRSLLQRPRGDEFLGMPPACPVEIHGRCYKSVDQRVLGCHRLARWRFTVAATTPAWRRVSWDATGLPGGDSRSLLQRPRGDEFLGMPPACPVEIRACYTSVA